MKNYLWLCTLLLLAALHHAAGQVSFAPGVNYPVGSGPFCVIAADVNGDGNPDLISANRYVGTLSVLTNDGSGGFGSNATLNVGSGPWSGPESVVAADITGDGKPDLISANRGYYSNGVFSAGNTLTVLTNNGFGSFDFNATLTVGSQPCWVTSADVNGDGKLDLICANSASNTLSVLTNNGIGGFVLASSPPVGGPFSVVAADLNGDSKVDLVSANRSSIFIFTNKNNGVFSLASAPSGGSGPIRVAAADVNGDGKPDLVSADLDGSTLTVLTNSGSGGFVYSATLQVGSSPYSVAAADVSGDGWPDLISANANGQNLSVLTNNGNGGFALAATLPVGGILFSVVTADVDGDSKLDLICANENGTLAVFLNTTYKPHAARATPIMVNGFVVAATIVDAGYGYTNTPVVYIWGGGGSGAQATTTVSNGNVIAVNILNAGFGYTSAPKITISPPFITPTYLAIAPATCLVFSNLNIGSDYQLQLFQLGTWTNLGSSFTASNTSHSQYVDWTESGSSYRLARLPIPTTATAVAQTAYGFVVGASITSSGAGYESVPTVAVVGGGGSGAQATATISDGRVIAINIVNAGFGYTGTPAIQVAPPTSTVSALLQPSFAKAFRLDHSGLTPAHSFQVQASPDLSGWTNFGTSFTATDFTNSQYFISGTNAQFFRLLLLP